MVSRQWKCILKENEYDRYIDFLQNKVLNKAQELPGFIKSEVQKRNTDQGLECLVITVWKDHQSIEAFAGKDINKAMVPEEAQKMMLSFDQIVLHYDII
ncbi:hypothetical protein [Roseivirga sp.]|uniref:hypothetical protein n=1 Tax=Roseivirga sp. TaxID=1964215 RepID=UPI003B8AF6F0